MTTINLEQVNMIRSMIHKELDTAKTNYLEALASLADWNRNEAENRAAYGALYDGIDYTERDNVATAQKRIDELEALDDAMCGVWADALDAAAARIQ